MSEDDDLSLYNTEDYDQPVAEKSAVIVKKDRFINEIKVDGQTFSVLNPDFLNFVVNKINTLETKCLALETELRNAKQLNKQAEVRLINLINQNKSDLMY